MTHLNLPFVCAECQVITYPNQGFCHACLSEQGAAMALPISGHILATSQLFHSLEENIQAQLPITVTSVKIEGGGNVFAVADDEIKAGDKVVLHEKNLGFGALLTAIKE